MSFFSPAFFKFFEQLEKNNNKEWFEANRKTYENEVKAPFKKFVTHIINELAKDQPDLLRDASKCIFRINRDIRFSKDKSPYKNNVAAVFNRSGTKDMRPGYYLHIGAKELFIGGGMYMLDKEQIEKVRQEIYYNADEFKKIISEKSFKSLYTVEGEKNKVLTPDYKEFAKEQPLIANKQFYFHGNLTREDILSKDLDKRVLKYFRAGAAFNDFLMRAISE
jgi:uncharacterized protein (TIGR02453 family)